jgi:capsular exopolysaccharide synthesis family protein
MSFMNVNGSEAKVIQVLSTLPHAGKTFVSTNLAVTMAMSGKKVLLVDLDLRRRTMTKQLGHRGDTNGLTAYMSGTIQDVNAIISKSEMHDHLDMMYAGLQPPNPAEMLLSKRLDDLFAKLREMYDYIIIDSVPAMAVADGIITNRLADLCLYVVRENFSDIRQLPDVERLHLDKKIANMCIVLNGSTQKRGYGYSYGMDHSLTNSNLVVRAFKRAFKK